MSLWEVYPSEQSGCCGFLLGFLGDFVVWMWVSMCCGGAGQTKGFTKRFAAGIASLRAKTLMSVKSVVADPYKDSWWRQRTSGRDTCVDWRDVKKCEVLDDGYFELHISLWDKSLTLS